MNNDSENLKKEIEDGINSGESLDFDPILHLKTLKELIKQKEPIN